MSLRSNADSRAANRTYGVWWRRAISYTLRIMLPTSFLSQLAGTILTGRSSPDGRIGNLIWWGSFLVVVAVTNLSAKDGRTWAHDVMGLQVCMADDGRPASGWRLMARDVFHLVDWAVTALGFLLPLVDPHKRTLADLMAGTVVYHAQ